MQGGRPTLTAGIAVKALRNLASRAAGIRAMNVVRFCSSKAACSFVLALATGVLAAGCGRWDYRHEYYPNYGMAKQKIDLGWLPQFLPHSATNIHAKLDLDNNRILASFEFSTNDLVILLQKVETVSGSWISERTPSRGFYQNEIWFPKDIVSGQIHRLMEQGFRAYEAKEQDRKTEWRLLAHPQRGVAYVWN